MQPIFQILAIVAFVAAAVALPVVTKKRGRDGSVENRAC